MSNLLAIFIVLFEIIIVIVFSMLLYNLQTTTESLCVCQGDGGDECCTHKQLRQYNYSSDNPQIEASCVY
ncbi:MAG: hypothetical protein JKX76_00940 [Colwellia sp.]|nr:hypothetical protein [Colwellia sp.]